MSPYSLLNISPESTDEEIRQAYLEQVKAHPPEREPQRFERIRRAHEKVKDRRSRVAFALLDPLGGETFEDIVGDLKHEKLREKWTLQRIRNLFTTT